MWSQVVVKVDTNCTFLYFLSYLYLSFSEIWLGNLSSSFKKMHLKMSSAKMAAILSVGDVLITWHMSHSQFWCHCNVPVPVVNHSFHASAFSVLWSCENTQGCSYSHVFVSPGVLHFNIHLYAVHGKRNLIWPQEDRVGFECELHIPAWLVSGCLQNNLMAL